MQRAGKRSADSGITLATVARARAACRPEEEGRNGVYLSTDLTRDSAIFQVAQSRLLRESRRT